MTREYGEPGRNAANDLDIANNGYHCRLAKRNFQSKRVVSLVRDDQTEIMDAIKDRRGKLEISKENINLFGDFSTL